MTTAMNHQTTTRLLAVISVFAMIATGALVVLGSGESDADGSGTIDDPYTSIYLYGGEFAYINNEYYYGSIVVYVVNGATVECEQTTSIYADMESYECILEMGSTSETVTLGRGVSTTFVITEDATLTFQNNYNSIILEILVVSSSFTVTFVSDGSTYTTVEVDSGDTVSAPTDPVRSGYYFGGWYTSESYDESYDFGSAVTSDLTLYAKWWDENEFVTVPTIDNVTWTATGSGASFVASVSGDAVVTWLVDGEVAAYGESVDLAMSGGSHIVQAYATNTLGSDWWMDLVTIEDSADSDGGVDWTLVAVAVVALILAIAAVWTRNQWVAIAAIVAVAIAVIVALGVV